MRRLKTFGLFISYFLLSFASSSQGISNLWLMGYDNGSSRPWGGISVDFKSGSLDTSYQVRKMNFEQTNGVICNKNGELLFSSNGVWVANHVNDTMFNGTGLNPSFYTSVISQDGDGLYLTQANLIIPFSSDSNKYYLFHQTLDDYPNTYCSLRLYYSIIDLKADGGKGALTQKNAILLSDSLIAGGLTACKHANGRDWWLIAHQATTTNLYYKFLITPNGILGPDTQSVGMVMGALTGQTVFSPNGEYFANFDPDVRLDIFDFDRCTGLFSPKADFFIDSALSYGIAFSPNSQVLYVSARNYVFQFDMNAPDIALSKTTVLTWNGIGTRFFLAHLAPDGKIYINSSNTSKFMHVINNPDVLGLGCNACQDCIQLPALNAWTIPNHPNYFLGPGTGSVCDTLLGVSSLSVSGSELKIYPNPLVSEDITFTYHVSSEPGVINIYDVQGTEVAQYVLPQWSSIQHLKLPKLESGIYLARLRQGEVVSSVKFVKE